MSGVTDRMLTSDQAVAAVARHAPDCQLVLQPELYRTAEEIQAGCSCGALSRPLEERGARR